ncbi:hypothetical protein [Aquimarina sediminis]|uniref:hypothetical protein n=1 Tax=Aquimarina sediminis TaxID=2070536 RepID=UPI000C9FFFC5|nr:hypothetical protein [Aquimarina sediminis]
MFLRKIVIIFFLILTVFSFGQCKTVEKGNENNKKPVSSMIQDSGALKLNKDKTMGLSIKKAMKQGDPAIYFEYTVYKIETKETVKRGTFRGTAIDWNDNTSLKLIPYVGMEQKPISENPEDVLTSNTHSQITIIKLNN